MGRAAGLQPAGLKRERDATLGPGQGGGADFDRGVGEQGNVAGGLGGGAGPAEGDGGQQPDNGKSNKQPSLHRKLPSMEGPDIEDSSFDESVMLSKLP
jgi:hypothetical protein